MLAVGPNGVGKTNLLESLHVGTQGFSPRTRTDAQLIASASAWRASACAARAATVPVEIELTLEAGSGKKAN